MILPDGNQPKPKPLSYGDPFFARDATNYMPISPADFEKLRTIVREEVDKALRDIVTRIRMGR